MGVLATTKYSTEWMKLNEWINTSKSFLTDSAKHTMMTLIPLNIHKHILIMLMMIMNMTFDNNSNNDECGLYI